MSKYRSRKATLDGQTFDSRREAHRYAELKLMERAGLISDLQTQVKFELIPKQRKPSGGVERAVTYKADFVYTNAKGIKVVEDTKGVSTQQYIIRRKLMLWVHGIEVIEI